MIYGVTPRICQGEILPVPQDKVQMLFPRAVCWLKRIPDYDLDLARKRLLSGEDKLWLASLTVNADKLRPYVGGVITTVRDEPPSGWYPVGATRGKRPEWARHLKGRSLLVHFLGRDWILAWIDSAVERISAYGHDEGCRLLFVKAKWIWRKHATKFWSPDWDLAAFSRDRPTPFHRAHFRSWNRVGVYRIMQPVPIEAFTPQHYNNGTMCYFKARS